MDVSQGMVAMSASITPEMLGCGEIHAPVGVSLLAIAVGQHKIRRLK
jgi:hypothetical protein